LEEVIPILLKYPAPLGLKSRWYILFISTQEIFLYPTTAKFWIRH